MCNNSHVQTICRKNLLMELIAKTKKQRLDMQVARDEFEEATERVDEKWKVILQSGKMTKFGRPPKENEIGRNSDNYDNLVCLIFLKVKLHILFHIFNYLFIVCPSSLYARHRFLKRLDIHVMFCIS